jgi:hypothetical protein
MQKKILLGLGLVSLLGGPALAEKTHESASRAEWKAADPALKHRLRLNRGLFNLTGQEPNLQATCGLPGGRSVRTKSNGWDTLFGIASVGLYTPQHAYIICNS